MHQIQEQQKEIEKLKKKLHIYAVLISIFIIILALLSWKIYPSTAVKPNITTSPLLDPELNQYPREDMIINLQQLRKELGEIEDKYLNQAEISLYLEILNTGANISMNKEMRIWPVSLTKLPLAMAVLKNTETGQISPKDTIRLTTDDLNSDSGELYKQGEGYQLSVEEALRIMLQNSDNTAYNALKNIIPEPELQSVLDSVGLGEIYKGDGSVSAKEYNRLLRSLYSGVYLNRKNSAYLLQILSETTFKDFLSQAFPEDITFAHKWGGGYREKVYADAGIVYLENRPFMITVMIKGKDNIDNDKSAELAKQIFKEIGEKSLNYIKNYHP